MRWKVTIIGTILLLLSSCVSTNHFLSMGGANGTKENLPVGIEVLLEMRGIVKEFTMMEKRLLTTSFLTMSFRTEVLQSSLVERTTEEMFNGPDARPFKDKNLV